MYLVSYLEHLYETFCPDLCSCAKNLMGPSHDKVISAWILKRGNLDYAETSGKKISVISLFSLFKPNVDDESIQ